MIDIHSSSGQRVNDIHNTKYFGDEKDASVTLNEDGKGQSARSLEEGATPSIGQVFKDSIRNLGIIGVLLNNDANGRNIDLNPGACADLGVNFDRRASFRPASFEANKMSSRSSFEVNSSHDDEIAASKTKDRLSMAQMQPILKCVLFGLLVIAETLSVFSAILYYPTICAFANLLVIGSIGIVFVIYDTRMRRRHKLLIQPIIRSEAILNNLFPEIVRDRILEEGNLVMDKSSQFEMAPADNNNGNFLDAATTADDANSLDDNSYNSISGRNMDTELIQINSREKPMPLAFSPKRRPPRRKSNVSTGSVGSDTIADYFPSATIMFADIVGFTSWASTREPMQVFELLETLYRRFDRIAKKKGVFKVETIGDCYVAATGLPNVMNDHAIVMASFARRCLEKMLETVAELGESLGPGTDDLGMRIGIHSGSCIGGVLRGGKSRYQLFGDTMNTASRIESTSQKNKIHLSEQTAELIMEAGKKTWVEPRKEIIFAKGKGELRTYWLTTEGPENPSAKEELALPTILKIDPGFFKKKKAATLNQRRERLVDYHTNVLKGLLSKLAAMHFSSSSDGSDADAYAEKIESEDASVPNTFNEEAMKGILFPTSTKVAGIASTLVGNVDPYNIDDSVTDQLRELISTVSRWHRDDLLFHSFEKASHTVLSITKLLAAIETTHRTTDTVLIKTKSMITHPLTQFVLVFAALVHDASEGGVQAANRSIRRACSLFFEPSFRDLRRSVCRSHHDYEFFRRFLGKSILVVAAQATDFINHQGNGQSAGAAPSERISFFTEKQEASNNALTIVEKLLRVSHVSYSLQHFLVFQKWNRLLFKEENYWTDMSESDNTTAILSASWYERELESFDDSIRLVRGLRDSGVCNKLADVYLNAAIANRREWQRRGISIVMEYISM